MANVAHVGEIGLTEQAAEQKPQTSRKALGEEKGHALGKRMFLALAAVVLPLKILDYGLATDWVVIRDLANAVAIHWSAFHWRELVELLIIVAEGVAAAAAITIAVVSVTVFNSNTSNYISAVWRTIVGPDKNKSPYVHVDTTTGKLMEDFLERGASALKAERDALKVRVGELERQLQVDDAIFERLRQFAESIKAMREPGASP